MWIRRVFLAVAALGAVACDDGGSTPVASCTLNGTCPARLTLGQACVADADCEAPAFCLTQASNDFFGGGSALGVCVADCTADAKACSKFKQAQCVAVDSGATKKSLCFEACTVGAEDPKKCHDRDNVVCDRVPGQDTLAGFCRPICEMDADCGARKCDRGEAVCVDAAGPPDAFGKSCDPGAPTCDGLCVSLADNYAVCSQRCKFGQGYDCQNANMQTGGCTFNSSQGVLSDTGFCGQLCDCNAQCSHPSAVCDPFSNRDLEKTFGRLGVCAPVALAHTAAGISACP